MKYSKFLIGFLITPMLLSSCSFINGNNNEPNIENHTSTHIKDGTTNSGDDNRININTINIDIDDSFKELYAGLKININIRNDQNADVKYDWKIYEGQDYISITSNNTLSIAKNTPSNTNISFAASYIGDISVFSNILSYKVINLDFEIKELDKQIQNKNKEQQNYMNAYYEFTNLYNQYMAEYNHLFQYCVDQGWIINGRDFVPTLKDQWQLTKNEMDNLYALARECDTKAYETRRKAHECELEIEILYENKNEFLNIKNQLGL